MSAEKAEFQEEESNLIPPDVVKCAENAVEKLIPKASKAKYDKVYEEFMKWRVQHSADSFSERTVLAFLNEKKRKLLQTHFGQSVLC